MIQPYVKNLDILKCPSFSSGHMSQAFADAACDGDPNVFGMPYTDPKSFLSHYGVALPVNSNNYTFWATCDTTGAQQHFAYPGAGYIEDVANISGWASGITATSYQSFTLSQVIESARTVMVGDGETMLTGSASYAPTYQNSIYSSFGCEGQYRHKNGGPNAAFCDGHSKYLPRNPESIITTDSAGCYYEKYYSWDK